MGRIATVLILLSAFIFLAFASQQDIPTASSLTITGRIDPDGNDHISMLVNLPQGHAPEFSFNTSGQMQNLKAYDEAGREIDANAIVENGSTLVSMGVPNGFARVEMDTDYLTSKAGVRWTYNSTLSVDMDIDNFEGSVILPLGTVVRSTNGILVANGGTASVEWHYSKLDSETRINRYINYQNGNVDDYTSLYALGAVLFVGAIILYALLRNRLSKGGEPPIQTQKKPSAQEKKRRLEDNPAFATMEETDKEILRELHAQEGKTTQARIYQRIHISKSSLSRHLISLENRGLVKRSRRGINTLVSLTDVLK